MHRLVHAFCYLSVAIAAVCGASQSVAMMDNGWEQYKQAFVQTSGAVMDSGNKGISHSEGQGYAMLLAASYGDRSGFRKLWSWTRTHLQVRDDRLFAWNWSATHGVQDKNNATDGDLLIAWALLRGAERWNNPDYHEAARRITVDILDKLILKLGAYTILMPAEYGFQHGNRWQINLSYWVYPALQELAQLVPDRRWQALIDDGKKLTEIASRGRWQLPPDWIEMTAITPPVPAMKRPPRFGYEAIRLPLYLVWSGEKDADVLHNSRTFWQQTSQRKYMPAWVDILSGEEAEYPAPDGFRAIWQLTDRAIDNGQSKGQIAAPNTAITKDIHGQDYYSASLLLLSRVAYKEQFLK
jgi:endoglucanase